MCLSYSTEVYVVGNFLDAEGEQHRSGHAE